MIVYLHFLLRITHNTETKVAVTVVRDVAVPVRHGAEAHKADPRTAAQGASRARSRAGSIGRR
jgi:hypothetical protein